VTESSKAPTTFVSKFTNSANIEITNHGGETLKISASEATSVINEETMTEASIEETPTTDIQAETSTSTPAETPGSSSETATEESTSSSSQFVDSSTTTSTTTTTTSPTTTTDPMVRIKYTAPLYIKLIHIILCIY